MEKIIKILPFEVKEISPRVLEFVGSTEAKDREGDIIMADGWKLANYKKNPVFMWAHNYTDPPVGKAVKVWAKDGQLRFHVQFAEQHEYDFADTVYKLYKGGYIRASSVGFIPIKSEPMETKEDDEDIIFGHRPTRFLQQELLELSGCPVPANPEALAEAKAKGIITDAQEIAKKSPGWAIIMEGEGEAIKGNPEKPYPNEHACRLREPDGFQEGSFRRSQRTHDGKKYSVIMGRLKGEDTLTDQAFRYHKETWTEGQAESHCNDHDGAFEAASGADAVKESYTCECIECGHTLETDEHCNTIKCPKCGGDMRRLERPGPGRAATTVEVPAGEAETPQKRDISQAAIADDIDFLEGAIDAEGLNQENILRAWELVRMVFAVATRESGSDIPVDIAEKIGAVLNKVNRDRLDKIKSLAQDVLDSAEQPDEPDKSLTREEAITIFREELQAVLAQARGKIRR